MERITRRLLKDCAAAGKSPLGNIGPLLYDHSSSFCDVGRVAQGTAASGRLANKQLWRTDADGSASPGPVRGWPTLGGYDMTTGLGTSWAPSYVTGPAAAP